MSTGLEPDLSRDEVLFSRFPIHRACRDGDIGALVSLLQHPSTQAHLNVEDSCYGWTPIHWAAQHGQLECVMRLVQMGCEVNTVTNHFKQTPTHSAAFGGHPHCLVWLTQAGADVNRQDFLGEAPIHKAARSGSLECIQILLVAGAKPSLRNASGQTAADLAHAHRFHDCFHLISKSQLSGLPVSGAQKENSALCGQELNSRKRLLAAVHTGDMKKVRRADSKTFLQLVKMLTTNPIRDMNYNAKTTTNGHHHALPYTDQKEAELPESFSSLSSPTVNQHAAAPAQHSVADMCGSLHLAGSLSSCVSHRPAWRGLIAADCGDFLHYGHYHGFGDTAEELSDSGHLDYCGSIQADHRFKQAVASTIHLYHGS
uniref:Uncharacterized protein n=1 Tax=Mola mola TaxID=94237 RepID=A0A3Q3VWJ7_MOLML